MSLRLPLLVAGGRLAVVADGSVAEIAQSAQVLLSTRVGERASEPEYGSRDDLFLGPDEPSLDTAALALFEPRATPDVVTISLTDSGEAASA